MARLKGGLLTSVFDTNKRAPLDSRELVTKYEDLINPTIWITNTLERDALYNGLRVSVNEIGENMGEYFLVDRTAITEENYNNYLTAKENGEDTSIYFHMWSRVMIINKQAKIVLNGGDADG
jgi:hypothetical protein